MMQNTKWLQLERWHRYVNQDKVQARSRIELDEISAAAVRDEILLADHAADHLILVILKASEVSALECH